MSKKGVLSGAISGGFEGAGAGMKLGGNPWLTAGTTAVGMVAGALGAGADSQETEEERRARMELEQQKFAEEKKMNNINILQSNRAQGMSALNYLASERGTANINARSRLARDFVLGGA